MIATPELPAWAWILVWFVAMIIGALVFSEIWRRRGEAGHFTKAIDTSYKGTAIHDDLGDLKKTIPALEASFLSKLENLETRVGAIMADRVLPITESVHRLEAALGPALNPTPEQKADQKAGEERLTKVLEAAEYMSSDAFLENQGAAIGASIRKAIPESLEAAMKTKWGTVAGKAGNEAQAETLSRAGEREFQARAQQAAFEITMKETNPGALEWLETMRQGLGEDYDGVLNSNLGSRFMITVAQIVAGMENKMTGGKGKGGGIFGPSNGPGKSPFK